MSPRINLLNGAAAEAALTRPPRPLTLRHHIGAMPMENCRAYSVLISAATVSVSSERGMCHGLISRFEAWRGGARRFCCSIASLVLVRFGRRGRLDELLGEHFGTSNGHENLFSVRRGFSVQLSSCWRLPEPFQTGVVSGQKRGVWPDPYGPLAHKRGTARYSCAAQGQTTAEASQQPYRTSLPCSTS
jgi:hypothetical protein